MKIKSLSLAAVILLTIIPVSFAIAEDSPKPVLKSGDVEHFIKTFPQLSKDFEKFGAQYEAKSGDLQVPAALKANQEFLGILKKYGWDENFFQKVSVILLGYSAIEYKDEMAKAAPGLGEALKGIESNPALSREMKEQMMKQMEAAQGALSQQQEMWNTQIHPKDMELLRPFVGKLKKVIEEADN